MTAQGALAITGLALLFAAVVAAWYASGVGSVDARYRAVFAAWVLFGISIAIFIGAAWWQALS